jgi:glutaredoxin
MAPRFYPTAAVLGNLASQRTDIDFLAVPRPRSVVLYSRKDCHLCDVVKETLARLQLHGSFTWREVDIDSDDNLRRQFDHEVPVVFIDDRKAFKYRVDEEEFLRRLARDE